MGSTLAEIFPRLFQSYCTVL